MRKSKWDMFIKRNVAIGLLLGMLNSMVFSDIIVDKNIQQNTSVDRAQNGANIININTPNNKGISVNDFSEFRTKDGTVFNNFGSGVGRSYLAGMMASNPNLTKEEAARLILNRVGGNHRVEIENWLEVMSANKTDIIFSSKNGFYLNNTGFINFDKAIFTSSRVDLDGNGDILPFNIRGGNIEIGREGINAEGLRYLAFLSKQISVDGQIYAKDADLDVIAGEFDYNPNTKEYTNRGTNNNELLISSSAYGSMYGNQIKVVANSGNVGVQGDLISYKVLKINADGTVVTNKIQGNEGIEIKGKEFTQNTSTYTEGNLRVEADKTTLKGNGTQAGNIEITGKLDNQTNIYGKGNVTVGSNTKSSGQIISEKKLDIKGDLESENLVYGKEEINVDGNLVNTSDIQSEGSIIIGGNTINKGKILTDNILHINGTTLNEGILYGKNKINLQTLTNRGSIQSAGDIFALNVLNAGKIAVEGNVSFLDLDNQNELVTNKLLTTNNITNTGTLSTGEGITSNGNVINYGELKTNGNFSILGNLNNYNLLNAGGLLSTRDLINHGNLKAVEKILTRGTTFYNQGEILTTTLDAENTNILNVNKITVIETARLKGNNINNQGKLSGTNIELITSSLINSNNIIADGTITATNTTLNNTGYIGSNGKLVLSGSNISNQGSLESNVIEMYDLFGYNNNGGSIKGNGVYLSTTGNIDLRGLLHGESDLRVSGYDIWNNGETTGTGYIEVKGHDIINNTELASDSVVVEGSGTLTNNSIITGTNGNISGYNIINNDLIAFSEQLGIRATDKLTNNAGKAIYAGELLDINFNTLENLRGELLSQGSIRLTGNYLLNKVGTIQANEDIELNIDKIDNIGEVTGLDDYEIYYKTWDGKIYTEAEFNSTWAFGKEEEAGSNEGRVNHYNSILGLANAQGGYNSLLDYYFGDEIKGRFVTDGEYGTAVSDTQMYPGASIKGVLKSNAQTTYANISAGKDITIRGKNGGSANELNNIDGKISAGERAELNVGTIKNQTTLGAGIQLQDGYEEVEWHGVTSSRRPVRYRRLVKNGDLSYVAGQASVIEAKNLVINTGNLILTPELDADSQIITGSTTSGTSVGGKITNSGVSNGSGIINIEKNMDPISEIKTTGVLPINPLGAQSSLFGYSKDPTSKYLLETRSQYINIGDFYGSDYYLSRIGYDENSDWNRARRLGDAYYEYLLVTRAISDKLGTRFINGLSDKELMKAMLDNSVELQKDLQLTVGVALTPDQVKALKSDVIWYEYEVVNGEQVLVPKVYLSQTTLATIETDGRDRIGGLELTAITADELRNNGQLIGNGGVTYINAGSVYNVTDTNQLSEIRGDKVSIKATEGNIENIGGRIKAKESLSLIAENGDIINSSSIRTSVLNKGDLHRSETDHILSVGSIESEGTTYIEGKNYISEAGKVSGKTTVIKAEENISIGSVSLSGEDKFGTNNDNYQYYKGTQKVGSEVSGTENVVLEAGNNLDIKGSKVASDGTVQMTAKNINIENEKENTYLESKSKYKSTFEKTESESRRSNEYAQGSTVVGNNVILEAENDINIKASTIGALKDEEGKGGNISVKAGNDINVLVETLDNSYYSKMKTKKVSVNSSSGGGGATAGVNLSKNSLEQEGSSTKVSTSTLISEGSTVLDAGNRIRTEAMQANIGENLVIKGKNGVDLLDAKEVYEDKVKQKSSSIGVSINVGFTPAQLANTVSDVSKNVKDYGFGDTSQTVNTLGNGLQDLRNVSGLTQNMRNWYGGIGKIATTDILEHGNIAPDNLRNAAKGMVSASVSASYSQSKYESNTSGSNSVAGNINVGKNFILQSDGDVTLVNQKIKVGENFVVDAKNFEVRAGENTYKNDTKSSSVGVNAGYDIVNNQVIGGANLSGGNSNTSSKTYDNSIINVGGIFQLTTKEDALFAGVNVSADKINFDIGRDLSIISLQDEYKSDGKNYGVGINVSGKIPGTEQQGSVRPTGSVNYGENHQDSKWTGNQTSILAENDGNVKVGETLTNVGSIIGSLNNDSKLSIEANKVVVENLKDHNEGSNYGLSMGGIGLGTKKQGNTTPVGQTGVQYGSHDKQQDSNATFVNTEVTEAGKKLNLEEMGINTDINKAQVVTKDKVVEQIDTVLHTDLLNQTTRDQVIRDINGLIQTPGDIIKAVSETNKNGGNVLDNLVGTIRNTDGNLIKYQEMDKKYKDLKNLPDDKKAEKALELANEMAQKLRENNGIGKDVDIVINFTDQDKNGEFGAFVRQDDKKIEIYINPKEVDVSDMDQVYGALGYEMNHYNPSNPYVYDKKDKEVVKGTELHDREEQFTGIGRKPIEGSGNSFYEDVLLGSNELDKGNSLYDGYSEEDLDFAGRQIFREGCALVGLSGVCKKGVNAGKKIIKGTVFEKPTKLIWDIDKNFEVKALDGAGEKVRENIKTTVNKIQTNEGTGKSNSGSSNNKGSGNSNNKNNTSNKSKTEVCNESCKQSNFVNSMNNYYNPKKSDSTDYLNKGVPDYGLSFEDSGLGPILAGTGIILGKSGFPLAGLVLTMPQTGLDISKGVKEIKNGNVERGVEYISSGVALGLGGYLIYQDSKTTVNQTTNKGVTPEKYYELKNKVGMTPEVAEVVNKNYGTNYIPTVVQENKNLYTNKKDLQDPYYGPKQKPELIGGKYKDTNSGYTMKGNYIYIIDEKGNLRMANSAKLTPDQGHTSLSGGQSVKYAGTMKFNNKGQLVKWTNESGHYEPNTLQAPEISDIFKSLGIPDATMDKFIPFNK